MFGAGTDPDAFPPVPGLNLFSRAFGVNDAGQAVGIAVPPSSCCIRAASFSAGSAPVDLGSLGGADYGSGAFGINNAGQIVGVSGTSSGNRATLFGVGSAPVDLGVVNGLTTSVARSVNNSGQIVGQSAGLGVGPAVATLFNTANGAVNLGILSGYGGSSARAIGDSGIIVGVSTNNGALRATLFSTSAAPVDLGGLGGVRSVADSVNSSGLIVGYSTLAGDLAGHAAIFGASNGPMDLNDLIDPSSGWELLAATAVNDAGQIVGLGLIGGQYRAFLATPVPEPGTLALLAVSLLGLRIFQARATVASA